MRDEVYTNMLMLNRYIGKAVKINKSIQLEYEITTRTQGNFKKIIVYNCILRVQFDDLHDNSYFCYVIGMLLLDMKAVVTMKKRTYITLS